MKNSVSTGGARMLIYGVFAGVMSSVFVTLIILGVAGVLDFKSFLNGDDLIDDSSKEVQEDSGVLRNKLEKNIADLSSVGVSGSVKIQEDYVVEAVEKTKKAVVSIIIEKDVPIIEQYYENPFGNNGMGMNPFGFGFPMYRENGTERKKVGGGSGFIVSPDGYIVTNKHVAGDDKASYMVFFDDGEKIEAKVIAKDPSNDIAILKIEKNDLPYLEFADSEQLKLGQTVIAIGNPLMEFNNSVSVGVVSGLSRSITAGDGFGRSEQLDGVIQTDAAINPGNSGGPLLNLEGKVVGVNVAVASAENIGFSLPSNSVKGAVESVKLNGKIVRPYLGLRYIEINEKVKETNKLSVDYGVLISRGETREELAVLPGSPADKAGLAENDIILEFDGKKLEKGVSLIGLISKKNVGDTVSLKILKKGEDQEIKMVLEAIPE